MRERLVIGGLALVALVAAGSCKDDVGITSIPPEPERFIAFLSGANEPTPITTPAQGLATITVNGHVLSYRIELSNIDSAFLAHIHNGRAGINGGVMVNLYVAPRPATDSNFTGVLVNDTITVVDSALAHIRDGTAYVNVHTKGPTGADGSGGHGGGEVRGQLFRFQ